MKKATKRQCDKATKGVANPAPSSLRRFVAPSLSYSHLHTTSNFTFLTGASRPEELVNRAAELGQHAIAITDCNTMAGVVRAHTAAKDAGVKLIVGCRLLMRVDDGVNTGNTISVLAYPMNRSGYARLCRLLTLGKRRTEKGQCDLTLHDLIDHHEDLLAVIVPPHELDQRFVEIAEGLKRAFDDDRLSIASSCLYEQTDANRMAVLASLAEHTRLPLVATNDVHYHVPERRALQDIVTCIREHCTLEEAGRRLFPNAERYLKSSEDMSRLFAASPEAIARTHMIAERAAFTLDELRYEYPEETCPPGVSAMQHLIDLTWAGAAERYPNGAPDKVRKQIEHEFSLIDELKYAPYFLTVHDLVVFARSRDILCQGRGAAANSAVCYCLGVTAVDPGRINLLFERFISRERNEPPDIDIDFEHERREEVIQYIYAKYGRERAALTAEVITYRGKSAIREVGKALGLSLDCIDRLAKGIDWWEQGRIHEDRVRELGLNPNDPTIRRLASLARELLGFPRHLSQHVGGFVITRTDLCELVPIENAAMPDRTVIEWDKDDIDAMGILKVDVLGLGMLTCIRKALEFVNGRHGGTPPEVARRHEGEEKQKETDTHDADQDLSGFDRMAESDEACGRGVCSNETDAGFGAVRADQSIEARVDICSVKHRRGIRETKSGGLHQTPENRARLIGGTDDTGPTGAQRQHTATRSTDDAVDGGNGQSPPGPHQEPATQTADLAQSSSCLRASVPSCLPLQLHSIPPEDTAVYDMICEADTIGVFQIESRAQMSMLPRLRPRCFYDLVIEVAIVRPGPIQGDMVHPYLRRRNGEEPVEYPNERVKRVLGRTLGVPLFQEQAMSMAVVCAGFTPGEADHLRRAMAAWKRSGAAIRKFGERIIDGMVANGYEMEYAERCFRQIQGFSEYGFPESHAASFALLVYVSAWLKKHHPAAFAAALINSQPMGFYAPAQIVRDAREHGVDVRPIDVNASEWNCTLEYASSPDDDQWDQPALRLGMRLIKGMREDDAALIHQAAIQHGQFSIIEPLWRASGVRSSVLKRLANADAFTSMQLDRQRALWEVQRLHDEHLPLFDSTIIDDAPSAHDEAVQLPTIAAPRRVVQDYAATGLSLKAHPMSFARDRLKEMRITPNVELADEARWANGRAIAVAGIVLVRQRPGTASGIVFMTIEDETGVANLIVRPHIFDRYRRAARHATILIARGAVERQGKVVHVMVRSLRDCDQAMSDLVARSRDFH